ncbi:MAG: hypothetical protein ABSH47_07050 [Bryobacteraceae bacterium]
MLVSLAFVGAVVAALIRSTMNLATYRVEVCMDYNGRTSCRTAAGSTEEFALRSATGNACALIASGVTDSMGCERTPPRSVRWLKRP